MMDFEGIDKIKERVAEGQTLQRSVGRLMEEVRRLRAQLSALPPEPEKPEDGAEERTLSKGGGGNGLLAREARAQRPGQDLVIRLARKAGGAAKEV